MVTPISYCVRWGKHQTNMSSASCNLFNSQMLVDVTLAADGVQIQAHKLVLAAASVYFQALFTQNPCQHPIVILKDVSIEELRMIVDFVYKGEVEVPDDKLTSVLKTARLLRINGFGDALMNETVSPQHARRASIHTGASKPASMWHSSSSSSTSSAQGLALFASHSFEPEYEQPFTTSSDVSGGKRKVPQTPPQVQIQPSEVGPGPTTMLANPSPVDATSYVVRHGAVVPAVPGSPPQTHDSRENVPFRKRMRREFRRERSLSGGDTSQLPGVYPERSISMVLPSRSTSHVENASQLYLNVDPARPPMQTQTSDPGPLRSDERANSPSMNYTSKHRKMLQRQPRIQRQLEQEAEEAAARRVAALKPRPSPTIIVTHDDESRPPEVICATKSSPDAERPRTPESDASAKDLTIDESEGGWSARSCPPSPPPSKISERSSSTACHRERRRKMQVVFSSAPSMSGQHGDSSGAVPVLISPAPSPVPSGVLSPLVPVPLPVASSSGHHCPESRTGSAVSCDYCWNKMDEKGRVQRRKTKYWCPKCRANLCIVPCFQQYHETTDSNPGTSSGSGGTSGASGGDFGAELLKTRNPFERSSSASYLLTVPKNLSKTSSI